MGEQLAPSRAPDRSARPFLYVSLGVAVVVLAALGKWNPRSHVFVALLLDHPLAAAEIVIVLLIAGRCPPLPSLGKLVAPVLLLAFVAAPVLLGQVVDDKGFSSALSVAGSGFFVDVRSFNWRTGQESIGSLYLREGSGLFERRVLIGNSKEVYDDTYLRAEMVEPGHLRVEWQWRQRGPNGQHWDIWFSPDTLDLRRVETTNGCAPGTPVECVQVPPQP